MNGNADETSVFSRPRGIDSSRHISTQFDQGIIPLIHEVITELICSAVPISTASPPPGSIFALNINVSKILLKKLNYFNDLNDCFITYLFIKITGSIWVFGEKNNIMYEIY